MQVLLRVEYGIEDKIRSITSTLDFGLSFFIGSSWQHVLKQQICRFVERANNFSRSTDTMLCADTHHATIVEPVQILVTAMRLGIVKSNWNLVKDEIGAYPEYKAIAWAQLSRDEKQCLRALLPEAVKLLFNAKKQGAIAEYTEASEDGLYWVLVKHDSPKSACH